MSTAPIDDGGPAYPVQSAADWQAHGMSLRDHFAERAPFTLRDAWTAANLAGAFEEWLARAAIDGTRSPLLRAHARMSYAWADAMLAERSSGTGSRP